MYLDKFYIPIDKEEKLVSIRMFENGGAYGYIDNIYPCGIFSSKNFQRIDFEKITILYGGNGSGKSTLLNLITNKLQLNRIAPYNSGELFDAYTSSCKFETGFDDEGNKLRIPNGSRIITSDDIFDYMLAVRSNNMEIGQNIEEGKTEYSALKFGETVKFKSMDDYENLSLQNMARSKALSRRKFLKQTVGEEVKLCSNGETALEYFQTKLKNDTLYCLDEPENSLSPKLQIQLVKQISERARYCGCQFIIATHSPFVLSLDNAKIYDLDSNPVTVKKWWELENTNEYFEFFYKNKELFLNK